MEYLELVRSPPSVLLQIDMEAENDRERRQVVKEERARADKRDGKRRGTQTKEVADYQTVKVDREKGRTCKKKQSVPEAVWVQVKEDRAKREERGLHRQQKAAL
ncbi:hypothetical protein NDU88_004698 [Pleurodeles waltl]|uniref:Uncharacterized protein n=1 Tax=Pleurodeles waltl TaxID=8319 RepID=A0AAV7QFZ7_PLEWA|nr:hypothetical protein NDU88_004698 [Pleurodeles waltl]